MRNREGLPGDQKDCTKILGNPQIARKHPPELPQNRHPFAIGQGSECNPPKTVAMPAQSFAILRIVVELQIPGDPITILFQTTPEANGLQSTQNRPSFATHSRLRHNRPKNNSNQHNKPGLQLNCRTTKDGNVIGVIALKLHGLKVNCGNCTPHGGTKTSNPSNLCKLQIAFPSCPHPAIL